MLLEPDRFLSPWGSKIRAEEKVKETRKETGAGRSGGHVSAGQLLEGGWAGDRERQSWGSGRWRSGREGGVGSPWTGSTGADRSDTSSPRSPAAATSEAFSSRRARHCCPRGCRSGRRSGGRPRTAAAAAAAPCPCPDTRGSGCRAAGPRDLGAQLPHLGPAHEVERPDHPQGLSDGRALPAVTPGQSAQCQPGCPHTRAKDGRDKLSADVRIRGSTSA